MKKFVITVLLTLLLCSILVGPSFAEGANHFLPRLIDNADLLTDAEESILADMLNEISIRLDCDVIVLTEAYIDDSARDYADDYFDYNGYGIGVERDGIIFLVDMGSRSWHISGSGICNSQYISTSELEYISENVEDDLGAEDYFTCFNTYAERCDKVITSARNGKTFKEPFDFFVSLIVSVVIGFIVSFIATSIMKGKLKSVHAKAGASDYLKNGSLNITNSRDMFLYRTVTRTEKKTESSSGSGSHTSSSGRSHSGVGGRF